MTKYGDEEEYVSDETGENWDELLENDEISPEEQAFIKGWLKAGRAKRTEYVIKD